MGMLRVALLWGWCGLAAAAVDDWRTAWAEERIAQADAALVSAYEALAEGETARRNELLAQRALLRIETGDVGAEALDAWLAQLDAGAAAGADGRLPDLVRARVLAERAKVGDADKLLQGLGGDLADPVFDAVLRVPVLRYGQHWDEALARSDAALAKLPAEPDVLQQRQRAQLLMERCYALRAQGKLVDAATACESSLALVRRATPRAANLEARVLYVLAYVELTAGDTASSVRLQNEALERLRPHPDVDQRFLTRLLQSLCEDLTRSDALDDAERLCAEAEANEAKHPSANPVGAASIAMARGEIARARRDWDRAVEHFRKGVALLEQRATPEHFYFTVLWTNMGHALVGGGRFDEGIAAYTRSLELKTKLLGPDNPELIGSLSGLFATDLRRGHFVDAEAYARRALALIERSQATQFDWEIRVRYALARALWGQDRIADALAAILEAQRVRRVVMARNIEGFPERRSLQYRDRFTFVDDVHVALVARAPSAEAIAGLWQAQSAARGLVTAAVAQRLSQLRGAADPAVRERYTAWREARERANAAPAAERAVREGTVDRAEEQLAASLAAVAAARAERSTALDAIAAALPKRSALIGFSRTRVGDPTADSTDGRDADWYALVREGAAPAPRLVALGRGPDLESAIDAWLAALRDPQRALTDVRARGARVRERLWQPLALRADTELVFVVPEGALHRVNLAALPDGEGWLAERGPRFHVLEHERDLLRGVDAPAAGADSALLVSAASVGSASSPLLRGLLACGSTDLPVLEGAQREVSVIAALLRGAGYATVTTLADATAAEPAVRGALPGRRVVHFATHGVPWDSECASGQRRSIGLAAPAGAATTAAPPQGGLVLGAGGGAVGADDGILSTDEIAVVDLDATDLAVLSACDTGRGPLVSGEGVVGLARAFRLAGARRTLVSLWPVDDQATATFMDAFYRAYLEPGAHIDLALRAGQRAVLAGAGEQARGHPFYWAAFVARGEWR